MSKRVRKVYRFLAWLFSIALAAGTLAGCIGGKYGPQPTPKYGPPPSTTYEQNLKETIVQR